MEDGPHKDTYDALKELAGLVNGIAGEIKCTPEEELAPALLRAQRLQIVRAFGRATEALEGLAEWSDRAPVTTMRLEDAVEPKAPDFPLDENGDIAVTVEANGDSFSPPPDRKPHAHSVSGGRG